MLSACTPWKTRWTLPCSFYSPLIRHPLLYISHDTPINNAQCMHTMENEVNTPLFLLFSPCYILHDTPYYYPSWHPLLYPPPPPLTRFYFHGRLPDIPTRVVPWTLTTACGGTRSWWRYGWTWREDRTMRTTRKTRAKTKTRTKAKARRTRIRITSMAQGQGRGHGRWVGIVHFAILWLTFMSHFRNTPLDTSSWHILLLPPPNAPFLLPPLDTPFYYPLFITLSRWATTLASPNWRTASSLSPPMSVPPSCCCLAAVCCRSERCIRRSIWPSRNPFGILCGNNWRWRWWGAHCVYPYNLRTVYLSIYLLIHLCLSNNQLLNYLTI